jgi:hypothetical protein
LESTQESFSAAFISRYPYCTTRIMLKKRWDTTSTKTVSNTYLPSQYINSLGRFLINDATTISFSACYLCLIDGKVFGTSIKAMFLLRHYTYTGILFLYASETNARETFSHCAGGFSLRKTYIPYLIRFINPTSDMWERQLLAVFYCTLLTYGHALDRQHQDLSRRLKKDEVHRILKCFKAESLLSTAVILSQYPGDLGSLGN